VLKKGCEVIFEMIREAAAAAAAVVAAAAAAAAKS
jgi:hypothetical protein